MQTKPEWYCTQYGSVRQKVDDDIMQGGVRQCSTRQSELEQTGARAERAVGEAFRV